VQEEQHLMTYTCSYQQLEKDLQKEMSLNLKIHPYKALELVLLQEEEG